MIRSATRLVSAVSLGFMSTSCALFDPDAPSHDHTITAGAVSADAVRDTATAIAIAQKVCADGARWTKENHLHWQAFLVEGRWDVFTSASSNTPRCFGWSVKLDKQTGTAISGCEECVSLD